MISDIFRYMSTEDNNAINYASSSAVLGAGEVVELETNEPHVVTATAPVYAYQVLLSYGSHPNQPLTGDPSLISIPSIGQFQFDYVLYTPPGFESNFVHVVAPNGMSLTIDGAEETVDCSNEIDGTVNGVGYCCLAQDTGEGVHVIEGDRAFGVYATGFSQFSSYGYTGGTGVQAISSGCVSGGPYLLESCGSGPPASTILQGSAFCPDGSTPTTFWSTPDITLGFANVLDLSTSVTIDAFGSFTVCLDVVCGSTTTQCCSSIDVVQRTSGAGPCP